MGGPRHKARATERDRNEGDVVGLTEGRGQGKEKNEENGGKVRCGYDERWVDCETICEL